MSVTFLTNEDEKKYVRSVNGATPDENGDVEVELDATLTQSGKAADAKVVGDTIQQISDDIAQLKSADVVTLNGEVITANLDEGTVVTVDVDSEENPGIVHIGKNFSPSLSENNPNVSHSGMTAKANDDGTFSLKGTATGPFEAHFMSIAYGTLYEFPPGEYVASSNYPADIKGGGFRAYILDENNNAIGRQAFSAVSNEKSVKFALDKPTKLNVVLNAITGISYDVDSCYVQIERGDTPTSFERFVRNVISASTPTNVIAYDGINNFYTEGHQYALTVEYEKGRVDFKKDIEDALRFDPSPYQLPILYLHGHTAGMTKDNAVELGYEFGDKTGTLTCKWQGNSSLSFPKKNYTLKFDNAFEAVTGWGEQKKYCMKANHNDFTQSRNVVSAKIWADIVRTRVPANATLATCPNYGAIDGFPIVIVLNGEFHGVYCFNIPKDGWMMNMGSGTNEAILCADYHVPATKFEGEAALDGTDFEVEYVTDENNNGWVLTSLNNLLRTCANSDGTDLDTTIASMLDWESAIDYYIFSALLCNTDGISKNYLLSTYDGVKWFFGAYDMDTVFGNVWNGNAFNSPVIGGKFEDIAVENHLFRLIKTHKSAELKQRYENLRKTALSEANVMTTFVSFAGQISKVLLDEENRKWPTVPFTSTHTIDSILNWYRLRCIAIDAEIAAM